MNPELESILNFITSSDGISACEKEKLSGYLNKVDRTLAVSEFKLERTEKVKRTTAILLEETIEELEQKQKAVEQQNRDLEIEAALERVRSRSMAMQTSSEFVEVSEVMLNEITGLGIKALRTEVCIVDPDTESIEIWSGSDQNKNTGNKVLGVLPCGVHPFFNGMVSAWKDQSLYFIQTRSGGEVSEYYENIAPYLSCELPSGFSDHETTSAFLFAEGSLNVVSLFPLTKEECHIMVRFANVFGQIYQRFIDLKNAEAQSKEAARRASLDRVRGQIASMRTTTDLGRITPLIWDELTTLGVPFIRCGVFIIDEDKQNVEVYLSAPNGLSLGTLNMAFGSNALTNHAVAAWKLNEVYHTHWEEEDFVEWTNYLLDIDQITSAQAYQGAASPPPSLDLHFIPFSQGMLYVGNTSPLTQDEINLSDSLADAFSMAYARYEDFIKLDEAKQNIEKTLHDLKAAQKQLIQSEKMASLGELTAGIAHEIKNPLNFVNNFSEVSKELLEEMIEELDDGHLIEVKEIADDVMSNLDKIMHHGRRADSIVKGMLQHSRTNSGEKLATDINNLVDEYIRLAYHGMRAKDKAFNVTLETHYDESLGKIEIVPQDMGRVILNLITNAFYACTEKNKQLRRMSDGSEERVHTKKNPYQPTVTISTKLFNAQSRKPGSKAKGRFHENNGDFIEIAVSDNGPGIPSRVLDKIFQPFFTTKPTGAGTGLGLSLSYDIVKAHEGELKVQTDEAHGTTFIIQLPVKKLVRKETGK